MDMHIYGAFMHERAKRNTSVDGHSSLCFSAHNDTRSFPLTFKLHSLTSIYSSYSSKAQSSISYAHSKHYDCTSSTILSTPTGISIRSLPSNPNTPLYHHAASSSTVTSVYKVDQPANSLRRLHHPSLANRLGQESNILQLHTLPSRQ